MDFMFLIATAAGAIATLAAAAIAALIVVKSLSSFKKWTNKDNEPMKKPRKKVFLMIPTNGKQETHEESSKKQQESHKELGKKKRKSRKN